MLIKLKSKKDIFTSQSSQYLTENLNDKRSSKTFNHTNFIFVLGMVFLTI
jgi:hypothetical protein